MRKLSKKHKAGLGEFAAWIALEAGYRATCASIGIKRRDNGTRRMYLNLVVACAALRLTGRAAEIVWLDLRQNARRATGGGPAEMYLPAGAVVPNNYSVVLT